MTSQLPEGFTVNKPSKKSLPEGFAVNKPQAQPEVSFIEGAQQTIAGGLESALALGSSIIAEPIAGLAGLATSLNPSQPEGAGAKRVEQVRGALTYEPVMAGAKAAMQNIGETLGPVTESLGDFESKLGDYVLESTGSETLAAIAHTLPAATLELMGVGALKGAKSSLPKIDGKPLKKPIVKRDVNAEIAKRIKAGSTDSDIVKKMVDGAGQVRKDSVAIETLRQGFDEGVIATIKGSNNTDKRRMLQMVTKLEKGRVNAKYKAKNRPSDVVGDSLLRQVNFVKKNNTDAGKQLNRVANKLKGKEVDISDNIESFLKDAENMGITFNDDLIPNFEGSTIETIAPARKLIKDILLKIRRNPNPDAFQAHEFKKFIDENVTFGKVAKGLGGKTETIAKKLRARINKTIGDDYGDYKEANTRFKDTIEVLDELQSASGSKLDMFAPNAEKALGTTLRALMSNRNSRVNLMNAVDNIDKVSKKYGGSFDDDILSQMLFADELDAMFGTQGRTSFGGEIKKAIKESRGGVGEIAVNVAADTIEKARGINNKNAIKSIKNLLKVKKVN